MSRPLRIEFPGAVYHLTTRGDRREPIYRDDTDRLVHLNLLAQAMDRFDAQVLAYCLMGNHFHLVLQTRSANLSRLMRHLNGVYTQRFNRRHGLAGHLFQGRFKAILVDRDAYLLALCRYVERNPVAAGLADEPGRWPWSSCRAHLGLAEAPAWMDSDGLHSQLLGRPVLSDEDRRIAVGLYADLVGCQQPGDADFWHKSLNGQVFLGDESFVQRSQLQAAPVRRKAPDIPKVQRGAMAAVAWSDWLVGSGGDRDVALLRAYREGGLTMTRLAQDSGLSVTHVSRLIAKQEKAAGTTR
jgi:REP element-mobilizing transposase RayT